MESIKEKIRLHLANHEQDTAKKIGVAIGMKDYPSDVVKALSEMRTDAEIECEKKKGKGSELWYWLTRTAPVCSDTTMPTDKACCNAAKVVATTAGSEVAKLRELLEDAGQVIANIRAALRIDGESSIVLAIEKLTADRNAHRDDVLLWERTMMKMVGEDGVGSVSRAISSLQSDLGHARIQIDALNEQLMAGEDAVDVKDAARGYLVCAPKRKPAKLMKAESAVARAKSAAKATGRCEVFALVPVGIATRKQIQAVEFKERAA